MGSSAIPLVVACSPFEAPEEAAIQPFVFRSLNLKQQDAEGRPLWELTSPETRYDFSRRVAQSRQLEGVLYSQGKPLYRFTAANGVVLNDGELVQLEGPTRLQRLDPLQPLVVTAQRVRWYPARKLMEIDRQPVATRGELRLTSDLVRFLIDKDRLELRGQPVLQRQGPDRLRLQLSSVDWFPDSGDLTGDGPVKGRRTQPGGSVQTFVAPSLQANTRRQIVNLAAPVQFRDPSRDARLETRRVRLDLTQRLVSTGEPFRGRLGEATLTGGNLLLDLATSTARIRGDCRLTQPGDSLQAERCSWNWKTGVVEASGGVKLRRTDNGQLTQSERLVARATKDGFVQFGGKGDRVRSDFRLPQTPQPGDQSPSLDPQGDQKRPAIAL